MTLNFTGKGIIQQIRDSKASIYKAFTVKDLNSILLGIRRRTHWNMIPVSEDKFGKQLQIGDTILVCFNEYGHINKAEIINESATKWVIQEDVGWGTQERRMDKNPKRIVKYEGL